MDAASPEVSVILPTCGREALAVECLRSILAGDFADFEVVVGGEGVRDDCFAVAQVTQRRRAPLLPFDIDSLADVGELARASAKS